MRQFRSDDTNKWNDGFGNYLAGDLTISSNIAMSAVTGCYYRTVSATIDQYSATLNSAIPAGEYIVKIVQVQQTNVEDNHEYNVLVSDGSSTTIDFKYKFQKNYSNALLITSKMWRNVTINANLTVDSWDGSLYGIGFLAGKSLSGTGGIYVDSAGFRGGTSLKTSTDFALGYSGEGYKGASSNSSMSANGNGAGSSKTGSNSLHGAAGSGGSNGSQGTSGEQFTDAGGAGTVGSDLSSDSTGVFYTLGGAGGGSVSSEDGSNVVYVGGRGAGAMDLLFKDIDISTVEVHAVGASTTAGGANNDFTGGAGAGGMLSGRCETINLGTDAHDLRGGTAGDKSGNRCTGGNGGKGRVAIRYSKSLTGSLSSTYYGTYSAVQDYTVIEPPNGGFIIPFLL